MKELEEKIPSVRRRSNRGSGFHRRRPFPSTVHVLLHGGAAPKKKKTHTHPALGLYLRPSEIIDAQFLNLRFSMNSEANTQIKKIVREIGSHPSGKEQFSPYVGIKLSFSSMQ